MKTVEEFTVAQAKAVPAAAEGTRMHACLTLSLLVGLPTEEARPSVGYVVARVDDAAGWLPVTEVGFDGGEPERILSRLGGLKAIDIVENDEHSQVESPELEGRHALDGWGQEHYRRRHLSRHAGRPRLDH